MGFFDGHATVRRQQADRTWATVCECGWQSEPATHPDLLGWVCGKAAAQQAVNDTAWAIVAQTTRRPR